MNKEANMKTILDIAKECGAWEITTYESDADDAPPNNGLVLTEAQLTATIEAWNRQNSEPVGQIMGWEDEDGNLPVKWFDTPAVESYLFTAPPQPQTSQEPVALDVQVSHMKESNGNQWWTVNLTKGKDAKAWDGYAVYQDKIEGRADYEADKLRHFLGMIDKEPFILDYKTDNDEALQSKPAKG